MPMRSLISPAASVLISNFVSNSFVTEGETRMARGKAVAIELTASERDVS